MKDVTIQDVLFIKKRTIPIFWKFLQENKLCFIFVTEVLNYCYTKNINNINEYVQNININFFIWEDSIKGFSFWKEQCSQFYLFKEYFEEDE